MRSRYEVRIASTRSLYRFFSGLPKELKVERLSPFEHLSDAELDLIEHALRAGRAKLVPEPEDTNQQGT